jgi:hypothetical protein
MSRVQLSAPGFDQGDLFVRYKRKTKIKRVLYGNPKAVTERMLEAKMFQFLECLGVLLFWGIGIGVILNVIDGVKSGIKSVSWPSTDGWITRSEIVKSTDPESAYEDAEVSYVYQVNGKSYSASVRSIGLGYADFFRSPERIISNYPLDALVKVYYDPSKPEVATLETGLSAKGLVTSLTVAVLLIYFGGRILQDIFGR